MPTRAEVRYQVVRDLTKCCIMQITTNDPKKVLGKPPCFKQTSVSGQFENRLFDIQSGW